MRSIFTAKLKISYIFLTFASTYLPAQNNNSIFYETFLGQAVGKIKGTEKNYVTGHTFSFSKNVENENVEWVQLLSAKNININLNYIDLNQTQIPLNNATYSFGSIYSISTGVDFRLAQIKNINLYFSPTIGLAYASKTINTNKDSYVFGSHLNAQFDAAMKIEYEFPKEYAIESKIAFTHFSNGAFKLPNAGVNAIYVGIGLKKDIKNFTENKPKIDKENKKNSIEIGFGAGQRGKYKMNEAFYRAALNIGFNRFINKTIGFKATLDAVYYNQVYNPFLYDDTIPYWGKSYEHFRLGASFGTEIKMNKISTNFHFGRYLYFKSPYNQKYYWKAGIRYYISPKFGLEGQLFAHKVQADFIGFGAFIRL